MIMKPNIVARPELAEDGRERIQWVRANMPVLRSLEKRFEKERPFGGLRAVVCVHLEAKTAYLAEVLKAGGAEVAVSGSNPDSTKDNVVAALAAAGLKVYARHGASPDEMREYMEHALEIRPHVVIDDGGDLVEILHDARPDLATDLLGVCEETTTGVERARFRAAAGSLRCPVLLINDARCKYLFDNIHGTGQSIWDAIMRSSNLVVAGKVAIVVGYGWCGRGIADRARGLGARVIVCEIDPVKALDAAMAGFEVCPLISAAPRADFIVTATGASGCVSAEHIRQLKSGAMLVNAGHFWDEINVDALQCASTEEVSMREHIVGYRLQQGWVYLLGQGHIANIACADGHPADIMDLSFSLQALCAQYLSKQRNLQPGVYAVPESIDEEVARLKLSAMGLTIDAVETGHKM